jgi:hypothetical protein
MDNYTSKETLREKKKIKEQRREKRHVGDVKNERGRERGKTA